ncbi:MAG: hypothetical protein ACJ8OJ_02265 [Povalibacter sp.]
MPHLYRPKSTNAVAGATMATRAIAALFATAAALGSLPASAAQSDVENFALAHTKGLIAREVKLESAEYLGRKAVRLTRDSAGPGFALVDGKEFQDGSIDVDVAIKLTGAAADLPGPGFGGVAFRARRDASAFELFYVRPGNSSSHDQQMRNHSVQYSSEPHYDWYKLRYDWPWLYEAHAVIEENEWTHLKIDVSGRTASIYVSGAVTPTLVVDGLKGEDLRGAVALWGFPGQDTYFSNLVITHVTPQSIQNGSEFAGLWNVRLRTDRGIFKGVLKAERIADKLSGTWTGDLGRAVPVAGQWRNGYVEFDLPVEMPNQPNVVKGNAHFAGWVDGEAASGTVRVEGLAAGRWLAEVQRHSAE